MTYYNGAKFTWQMGRQLASAQMSDGTQISYKYNADGIRTEKKINDTTTTYTLIGSKITGQTDGTNTFYFRYDENDNLIGFELGNKQYFYITNLVGDIIAIVDSDGAAVVKYEYDPWGVCTIVSDTSNCNLGKLNPFRYRGYYYDEETSLYYLQSRYYDPATMRFINADDPNMLLADCYNPNVLYRWDYCENNPVMFVDKDGYSKIYNYSKAVQYALKYANLRNPSYYSYTYDCANFVSQCLYAGGLKMNSTWHSYRYAKKQRFKTQMSNNNRYNWNVTKAWSMVNDQYKYFKTSVFVSSLDIVIRRADLIKKVLSNRKIIKGDIMYFDYENDGILDHATIITKVTKDNIYYTAHTNSRKNEPLKNYFKKHKKGIARILHFK